MLHGYHHKVAKRLAVARQGGASWMDNVIKRIIERDYLKRPMSPPARMLEPPTPQRAILSGLNAHLPQFCYRIDLFDKADPVWPVWLPCRLHLELNDSDNEQNSDVEPEPPKRRKKAWRSTNLFIDAETCVDGNAGSDEKTDDEIDDLDKFSLAKNVEYFIIFVT